MASICKAANGKSFKRKPPPTRKKANEMLLPDVERGAGEGRLQLAISS
jgi:hypothetical protein